MRDKYADCVNLTSIIMTSFNGGKLYYNPETKEVKVFHSVPDSPWVKGRPPWQKHKQSPEHVRKRAESMRKRVKEKGATKREIEGYKKLSKTRKEGNYSPSPEAREKISKSLTGRPQKWEENKSRASCRRGNCNIVYILKIKSSDGVLFGKWGSTREKSFKYRAKEFKRKGLSWELFYWKNFGNDTEDVEAIIGRNMSKFPVEGIPHFYGHTETFSWTKESIKNWRSF